TRAWVEHNGLARSKAADIHQRGRFGRRLAGVVALVRLRLEVDLLLCPPQRVEIALYILLVRVGREQETHHERGVDNLPKAQLLHDVELRAEDVHRRHFAREQQAGAIVRRAREAQVDLTALEKPLQTLDGRVVTARVVADADLDAGQVLRSLVGRLGR